MHLKKKSQEAKAEVAKKSHEEDQVKVIYNVDIYQLSNYVRHPSEDHSTF